MPWFKNPLFNPDLCFKNTRLASSRFYALSLSLFNTGNLLPTLRSSSVRYAKTRFVASNVASMTHVFFIAYPDVDVVVVGGRFVRAANGSASARWRCRLCSLLGTLRRDKFLSRFWNDFWRLLAAKMSVLLELFLTLRMKNNFLKQIIVYFEMDHSRVNSTILNYDSKAVLTRKLH